ncbi:SEN34 subunit of tRNA-splicing endonuclease [Decorospora gaudefroyi]|uniref:tRNA-intron lyase n=1 Tax=Decorospora gaudefroyi TaxID=184978 RepID=A0A6A5KWM8_9PLEO|nr:SEN34 subunit of tRNA-splicing endonuclease [Decorospora gaudefroyi]
MAAAPAPSPITEPFTISLIAGRYLLFDVDVIAHCRRAHNICGLLVGTIPNLSQQNVFLGIPLELMPEEARVLVDRDAAYVVDDAQAHQTSFAEMSREERLKYMEEMDRRGDEVSREQREMAERRKERALREKGLRRKVLERENSVAESFAESTATDETFQVDDSSVASSGLGFIMKGSSFVETPVTEEKTQVDYGSLSNSDLGFIMKGSSFSDSWVQIKAPKIDSPAAEASLFEPTPASPSPAPSVGSKRSKSVAVQKHFVTPTTSYPPLPTPAKDPSLPPPAVPNSYPLFRYLHSKGYFHMPGLRFGCHYNVYPGDPLRYHSHFAATGLAWDQEFDLLDVVGGGRLGTGTKKAYMIGGEDPEVDAKDKDPVRAFSIEWAAL